MTTTRRAVLTGAAAAGVAVGIGIGHAEAGVSAIATRAAGEPVRPGPAIPRTLSRTRPGVTGTSRVSGTDFPLSHLAVSWTGSRAPGLRLRTRAGWADWLGLHACSGGKDGTSSARRSTVLTVPDALGYEVSLRGSGTAWVTELNTVDGPAVAAAAPAGVLPLGPLASGVRYLSRAAWGANDALRFKDGNEIWPAEWSTVQTMTVHHTAGANNDPNPTATVRAIYQLDAATKGWGDMGYHLLIDEAGTVYEGRASGTDGVPVFNQVPARRGSQQMNVGAHVGEFNVSNLGVVLLGDFTSRNPTAAARASLAAVLASLSYLCQLDPSGITNYVNSVNGNRKTVHTVSGHLNWAATQCPGNTFYPQLATVRGEAMARLRPTLRQPATSPVRRPRGTGATPAPPPLRSPR